MVKGVTFDAMVAAVNLGRDTDCAAAVAAGISGALTGAGSIPPELIKQVDYATTLNVYTNSQRTLRQHADGLYEAFQARLRKMKAYAEEMARA
jgi:ADP-ribosylglycohydrolase